ncbi:cytochrome b [Castellaniella caeni]|uniref:cytochrome b n=1 Tax=Castellaniella caeni TaxID=266123 RepID=UPI00082FB0FB|nr:cytochrome b [Castellaniella caeni]
MQQQPLANIQVSSFHPMSIAAHWLTVILLIAVYALIELRGIYPKGTAAHDLMKIWHEMLGLTVFGLVFIRLILRGIFPAPDIHPAPPLWQHRLATAMHWTLYAFLVVMPVLGWVVLSAKGKPVPLYGLNLPALVTADPAFAKSMEAIHETIGKIGYGLIGLHALAALWHHYIIRDDTLHNMLPSAHAKGSL